MQDYSSRIAELRSELEEARGYLRVDELRARRPQLEAELGRPDLWDDPDEAQALQREFAELTDDLELYERLESRVEDLATLHELAREEGDESLEPEIESELDDLEREFAQLELRALFTGEFDDRDAIVEVNSGAGGVDAQDWAEMLVRMYLRWAERKGFEVEMDSVHEGSEAGISSASFVVKGRNAYGLLRSEHGVHRLVRISPFDNNARRQTSFASVKVTPFIDEVDEEIQIDDKDLRIDVYRSSGAGGQHVNVTDSAVRITHLPTGIVTSCQNERSQHQNKERAMKLLKSKLLDLEREKRQEKLAEITGQQSAVDFGSQDRNYVLQPYQQVKDLRSGLELSNPDAVLDGEIDELIEAFLRWQRAEGAVSV
ncbi:MAG TPA: peptide chain release factor 2 [Microthrixaceae bacterium]|nr:peptide chain release factor 2 [Microthrixaceae bacterium]